MIIDLTFLKFGEKLHLTTELYKMGHKVNNTTDVFVSYSQNWLDILSHVP